MENSRVVTGDYFFCYIIVTNHRKNYDISIIKYKYNVKKIENNEKYK